MADTPDIEPLRKPIRFHYIKSNFFRVIHVDGALGGVTVPGFIHCAVYSERAAIPQVMEHDPDEEGGLGKGRRLEGKVGFVREVEADLMLSRDTAEELREWLTLQIEKYDALAEAQKTEEDGEK